MAHMQIWLVALKLAAAHLAEGDARTVVGVDIGCYLEDKASELRFVGLHHALLGLGGSRTRCYLHEAVEQLLHTEVVECRTEEHGGNLGTAIFIHIKLRIHSIHEFQVLAQFGGIRLTHGLVELIAGDVHLHLFRHPLFVGSEEIELLFIYVIHTLELHALVDRP